METVSAGFFSDGELSGYWFERVVSNPILMPELGNTVLLAVTTTLVCIAISLPLAVIRARYTFAASTCSRPAGSGAVDSAAVRRRHRHETLPRPVRRVEPDAGGDSASSTWPRALPPDWLGSGFVGVVILQALHLFPILYLNITAALANVDPAYAQAARNLGASRLQTFLRITFPLIMPGLFAGGTIVFIWSFTDIGTPVIVGYEHLTPVTIFKELANAEVNPRTFSLVFIMLSASVSFYLVGKFFLGRGGVAGSTKASVAAETTQLGPARHAAGLACLFGIVIFLSVLPHARCRAAGDLRPWVNSILPDSYTMRHLVFVITSPDTLGSIVNSLKYAGLATVSGHHLRLRRRLDHHPQHGSTAAPRSTGCACCRWRCPG